MIRGVPRCAMFLGVALGLASPVLAQERVSPGTGAVLRGLDKISGESRDVELATGTRARLFGLEIKLSECRYPAEDPAGDAFAWLTIREVSEDGDQRADGQEIAKAEAAGTPLFSGWMIASSPALNALAHSRYDVWVIRCTTAAGSESSG